MIFVSASDKDIFTSFFLKIVTPKGSLNSSKCAKQSQG